MKVRRRNHPHHRDPIPGAKESRSHVPQMRTNGPTPPALYTHDGEPAAIAPAKKEQKRHE
jgi:hypothetical protein